MRVCELRQHNIISYYPSQLHKQKYKLGEYVSADDLTETMFGLSISRFDKNEDKIFRVMKIKYVKFPWWKFWKRRKYVKSYHLEII